MAQIIDTKEDMTFAQLGLHQALLKALADSGYGEPTPVQTRAIPAALGGQDLIVSAQTGSGKTAAFMLPALHRLAARSQAALSSSGPRQAGPWTTKGTHSAGRRFQPAQPVVLVLTPTRELAQQVTAAAGKYARQLPQVRVMAVVGGMPYAKQLQLLAGNPAIVVATPGRLVDHIRSRRIDLSRLDTLVLDEADRMLDMGFAEEIEAIVATTPASRQTLLFSATLDGIVGDMARRMTRDSERIRVGAAAPGDEHIEQRLHFVDDLAHKNRLLDHLLRDATIGQALVFTATRRDADTVCDRLNLAGFSAAALHGEMHQSARNRTLEAMRRGQLRILVATDVAARGIDVPSITHVFNFDLPRCAEDYVHRIGRTGRAGRGGLAISLVNHGERFRVRKIESFTRQPIRIAVVAGHEPARRLPPAAPRPVGKPAAKGGELRGRGTRGGALASSGRTGPARRGA